MRRTISKESIEKFFRYLNEPPFDYEILRFNRNKLVEDVEAIEVSSVPLSEIE